MAGAVMPCAWAFQCWNTVRASVASAHLCRCIGLYIQSSRAAIMPHAPAHRTMAQRDWMGSMILEDWLQASAKRVVEL